MCGVPGLPTSPDGGPRHAPRAPTTRLAPSPTGALHLGNARTFLINWALARSRGWRVLMRIEDLDGPRVKPGADQAALDDLAWLGLDWDGPALYQRSDPGPYRDALDRLAAAGRLYACTCSRSAIRLAQSAPHADAHEVRYPGTCRRVAPPPPGTALTDGPALRVRVPEGPIAFRDEICGHQAINVQDEVGDFVVATRSGLPAYQLAVVVDDHRQGVTDVVRGDDLLRSTARQLLLAKLLGLRPPARYWHVPLVCGPDGRRLAKRHGDTRVAWYRDQGADPTRVVGLAAHWCGLCRRREPMDAATFAGRLDLAVLPSATITFTPEDHAWLLGN